MPLIVAPTGKDLRVTKASADEKTRRHLENLGILTGAKIVTLSESNGNVILKIKDGRLALDRQLAMKIFVA